MPNRFALSVKLSTFARLGQKIHTWYQKSTAKNEGKKDEAFKTVCFKSLKALFSVEADKPDLLCQILYRGIFYHLGLIPGANGN